MKIAIVGYGKMGHMVERMAPEHDIEITARFMDVHPLTGCSEIEDVLKDVAVLVDFSIPDAVINNIRIGASLGKNMVIGTTGWYSHLKEAEEIVADHKVGLVYASNFSVGVHLFYRIVESAGRWIAAFDEYNPYVMETHHRFKKDAPSGTALQLKKRLMASYDENDIAVSSLRAGYIPGTHEVGFDSPVDTITLKHTARTREGFSRGALLAAKWVAGKKGFYPFRDVVEAILHEQGINESD
jgi:4-hydroxy-tetrahydrodipicolinate reductase